MTNLGLGGYRHTHIDIACTACALDRNFELGTGSELKSRFKFIATPHSCVVCMICIVSLASWVLREAFRWQGCATPPSSDLL